MITVLIYYKGTFIFLISMLEVMKSAPKVCADKFSGLKLTSMFGSTFPFWFVTIQLKISL